MLFWKLITVSFLRLDLGKKKYEQQKSRFFTARIRNKGSSSIYFYLLCAILLKLKLIITLKTTTML